MYLTAADFRSPGRRTAGAAAPWIWFACGGVAAGVGIVAAVWLLGRGQPGLAPARTASGVATATTVSPAIAQPVQPAPAPAEPIPRPPLIEVRVDSSPSGSVFADGLPAELCRTPCSFDIDPSDGGATDRRTFVIRQVGYRDSSILVDLVASGHKREFEITLQRVAVEPVPGHTEPRARDRDGKASPERRPGKRSRPARKDSKQAIPEPPDTRDVQPPDDDPASEPSPVVPAPARKPPGAPVIDPADTLDPFRKK
jgi:hypothetical protein